MADEDATTGGVWPWFPTHGGGVRRSEVTSFAVERVDGEFKGGHGQAFTVTLIGPNLGEDVKLRPMFFDPQELCTWVDMVFPGAAFTLLPPAVVTEAPDWVEPAAPEGVRFAFGHKPADAIRTIGDGLASGNS